MKLLVFLVLNLIFAATDASKENDKNTKIKPVWTLTEGCDKPESSYFDPETKNIFISVVGGDPAAKDGNGLIVRLDKKGDLIAKNWVSGLNAPKGLRAHGGTLWTADIDQVVAIKIADGTILKKIDVAGAKMLNDVAIDKDGIVYVSDTLGSKIYRIENDKVSEFIGGKNLESPNGLLIEGNKLIVAAWGYTEDWTTKAPGHLFSIGLATKQIKKITPRPLGNLDGLENDGRGNYLVSDWVAGKIFRVKPNGKSELMFYGFKGSADIGYISSSQILIVPRMNEDKVTAYSLGKL